MTTSHPQKQFSYRPFFMSSVLRDRAPDETKLETLMFRIDDPRHFALRER